MIDRNFTMTQLQVFLSVAELGSFSAAARSLDKAQSAVSHAVSQLEKNLCVELFDRSKRLPQLTDAGRSLAAEAKFLLKQALQLQDLAQQWSQAEPEHSFSLAVDMLFPLAPLVKVIKDLKQSFPKLNLVVHTEARGAVTARIADRSAQLGITGLLPKLPSGMEVLPLSSIELLAVAAKSHPITELPNPVSLSHLRQYTQLVLDDRSKLSTDQEVGVVGSKNWKIGSQEAKLQFLKEGFGWGVMPRHQVQSALQSGELSSFRPIIWSEHSLPLSLFIVYRDELPLGRVAQAAISSLQASLSENY